MTAYTAQPGELRLDKPGGPAPDVARHAAHPGVGRALVRRELGLHDRVAQRAAEFVGVGVVVPLVHGHRKDDGVEQGQRQNQNGPAAVLGPAQIDHQRADRCPVAAGFPAGEPDAQRNEEQPGQKHHRQEAVGEQVAVGAAGHSQHVQYPRGDDEHGRHRDHGGAQQAEFADPEIFGKVLDDFHASPPGGKSANAQYIYGISRKHKPFSPPRESGIGTRTGRRAFDNDQIGDCESNQGRILSSR